MSRHSDVACVPAPKAIVEDRPVSEVLGLRDRSTCWALDLGPRRTDSTRFGSVGVVLPQIPPSVMAVPKDVNYESYLERP